MSALSWEYLQTIPAEPLPRLEALAEAARIDDWRYLVRRALESDAVGLELYDMWPNADPIPQHVWEKRVKAQWARAMEYDRLTAEREASKR